jgi:hypothetical protein
MGRYKYTPTDASTIASTIATAISTAATTIAATVTASSSSAISYSPYKWYPCDAIYILG